jgi:hypothetical protein
VLSPVWWSVGPARPKEAVSQLNLLTTHPDPTGNHGNLLGSPSRAPRVFCGHCLLGQCFSPMDPFVSTSSVHPDQDFSVFLDSTRYAAQHPRSMRTWSRQKTASIHRKADPLPCGRSAFSISLALAACCTEYCYLSERHPLFGKSTASMASDGREDQVNNQPIIGILSTCGPSRRADLQSPD